jgi:hypothetical protein
VSEPDFFTILIGDSFFLIPVSGFCTVVFSVFVYATFCPTHQSIAATAALANNNVYDATMVMSKNRKKRQSSTFLSTCIE